MSFRLDRLLTIYLFRPFTVKKQAAGNKQIPILMYHSISDEKEKSHPYFHVNTSPVVFEAQMRYLYENNYAVINLQDLENSFATKDSSEYVVITFDDGLRDFHTNAYPILNKFGFGATVFLPTGFINNERLSFKGKECLTWDEVRFLHDKGIVFGSHTVNHPQLNTLTETELEYEIQFSKKNIEDNITSVINTFSYPYKFPDEDRRFKIILKKLLQKHGYKYGVSTRIGTTSKSDDIIFRKRIPINSQDDLLLFQAKLEGYYDWLYYIQNLKKYLRSKITS